MIEPVFNFLQFPSGLGLGLCLCNLSTVGVKFLNLSMVVCMKNVLELISICGVSALVLWFVYVIRLLNAFVEHLYVCGLTVCSLRGVVLMS